MGVAIFERVIARMQAVQNRYFPDLADVHRPLTTQNLAGAVAKGDSIVYSQVPCQVSERVLRQLTEKITGGRLESGIRWVVVLPTFLPGTLIPIQLSNDDVLFITEHRSGKTMTLQVNGVQVTESWETAMTVECQLVA